MASLTGITYRSRRRECGAGLGATPGASLSVRVSSQGCCHGGCTLQVQHGRRAGGRYAACRAARCQQEVCECSSRRLAWHETALNAPSRCIMAERLGDPTLPAELPGISRRSVSAAHVGWLGVRRYGREWHSTCLTTWQCHRSCAHSMGSAEAGNRSDGCLDTSRQLEFDGGLLVVCKMASCWVPQDQQTHGVLLQVLPRSPVCWESRFHQGLACSMLGEPPAIIWVLPPWEAWGGLGECAVVGMCEGAHWHACSCTWCISIWERPRHLD